MRTILKVFIECIRILFTFYVLVFWPRGILAYWPGIEPTPSALEDRVLTSGPLGIPGGACGKESASQCRSRGRCRFDPWVGKIPLRRKWHPTPVFLPEKFHGQRSFVGDSSWGHKESDTTKRLNRQSIHGNKCCTIPFMQSLETGKGNLWYSNVGSSCFWPGEW